MSCGTNYDLDITKGSTYSVRLVAKDSAGDRYNLSGWSSRGIIRYSYGSTGTIWDLAPTVHTSYVSGIVDVTIPATGTATLPVIQGVYDVEIYTTGANPSVIKIVKGRANIYPESTY